MLLIWRPKSGKKIFLWSRKVNKMRLILQFAETPPSWWEIGIQLQPPRKSLKSFPTTSGNNICSADADKVPQGGASVHWS